MAAANINTVVITGNLTSDPEVRYIGSGTAVVDLGIAVNSREKQGDEWVDRADFFDVTVWGKQAESCGQYLSKGSPVAVQGRLRLDRWEKDGAKRSKVKIVATSIQFLPTGKGRPQDREQARDAQGSEWSDPNAKPAGVVGAEDDIPF